MPADEDMSSDLPAIISSLSYSSSAGILAAGSSIGRLALWKHNQGKRRESSSSHMHEDPSMDWLLQRNILVAGRIDDVLWSHDDRCAVRLV